MTEASDKKRRSPNLVPSLTAIGIVLAAIAAMVTIGLLPNVSDLVRKSDALAAHKRLERVSKEERTKIEKRMNVRVDRLTDRIEPKLDWLIRNRGGTPARLDDDNGR